MSSGSISSLHALLTGPPGVGKTTLIKKVCSLLEKHNDNLHISGFYTEEVREEGRRGRGGKGARIGFDVVTLDGERGVLARIPSSQGRPVSEGAAVRSRKQHFVGRYQVDVDSFERIALPTLAENPGNKAIKNSPSKTQSASYICKAYVTESEEENLSSTSSKNHGHGSNNDITVRPNVIPEAVSVGEHEEQMPKEKPHFSDRRLVVVDEIGKMELFSPSFIDAVKTLFEQQPENNDTVVLATLPAASYKSHWLVEDIRHRVDCRLFQVTERNRDSLVDEVAQFILQRLKY